MWLRWTLSWLTHGRSGKDEVWADVIIALGPECCGGRMMSGWTLSWFWPVGAEGNG